MDVASWFWMCLGKGKRQSIGEGMEVGVLEMGQQVDVQARDGVEHREQHTTGALFGSIMSALHGRLNWD